MIMQDVDDTNSSGLSYKGLLHLLVTPLATLPAEGELLAMNAANELLLGGMRSLAEKPDIEDADMLVLEMRRLDQKLSLVLDLLNTLLRINDPLPPPQLVLLQSARMVLQTSLVAAVCYQIELFLDPSIPKALKLAGRPVAGAPGEEGVTLEFLGVGQNVIDGLDKFLFRQHRRQIAQRLK
jgi:hypothetical protein